MAGGINATCGLAELLVFIAALIAGTGCSLTSKVMLSMRSVGLSGQEEEFSNPLFQTFGMFLGMTAGLVMHFVVMYARIPFPGYVHKTDKGVYKSITEDNAEEPKPIPVWMYFLLIIPALFDLVATALCMFGLRYVNVSIYQMLRGGAIVFVAILKQFVLGDKLKKFMWVGVGYNVLSIVLVGCTAMLTAAAAAAASAESSTGAVENKYGNPLIGVALILSGAFVQSLQYAFEERVMSMDIAAPPLLLIGMEGLWGTIVCLFVLYPLAYRMPGGDHGSIENPYNTYEMFVNSTNIQSVFCLYFISIFFYNVLACLVTYMLNSVWHAILDNFRPITVWGTDLFIFYFVSTAFGESWTEWSYVQLLGLFVLLYGTAVYNAPNPGSVKLLGEPWSCFMNFSDEYLECEEDIEDDSETGKGKSASYMHTMSPFMSPKPKRVGNDEAQDQNRRNYGGTETGVAMQSKKQGNYA